MLRIKDLREAIAFLPDDMPVFINNEEYDGYQEATEFRQDGLMKTYMQGLYAPSKSSDIQKLSAFLIV